MKSGKPQFRSLPRIYTRGAPLMLAALCLTGGALPPPVETVLYRFMGAADGGVPYAGLIADQRGALYGATDIGGASDSGTIFKLTPSANGKSAWTKTVLYEFTGGVDGAQPQARLIADPQGSLYGATIGGGIGVGVIFKLTPPADGQSAWTETVLHSFTGGDDGAYPSGLIADDEGALYGAAEFGGGNHNGTVFKLTPPVAGETAWTETVLHDFAGGSDGVNPLASPIVDKRGALYGTTSQGGSGGNGTVFKLTPPAKGKTGWKEDVLYSFQGGRDGAQPNAGLIADAQGALYGVTSQGGIDACQPELGCGTVFRLTPPVRGKAPWTETLLHKFKDNADGSFPAAALIADRQGALYGSTSLGGGNGCGGTGCGTIFKLRPPAKNNAPWPKTVLFNFKNGGGAFPGDILVVPGDSALYGAASQGGRAGCDGSRCGTVFKLTLCQEPSPQASDKCPAFDP